MLYLDNNATTRPDPAVVEAMHPYLAEFYTNPSSPYGPSRGVASAIWESRCEVAALLQAEPEQIVFAGGGSEANNAAIFAAIRSRPDRKRIVISSVEHASVLVPAAYWEREGYQVVQLPVGRCGLLDIDASLREIDDQTALVSVMRANNETGILNELSAISEASRDAGALMHTDAVQAIGKIPVDATGLQVDFLSLSAHKFHGPKGIGALYVRSGTTPHPLIMGGEQERGHRAGTENVAGIIGLGCACARALAELPAQHTEIRALRDDFEHNVLNLISDVEVIGATHPRLPNTSSMSFLNADAEALIALLDMDGICCSSGSACAAGSSEPSHVLRAMNVPDLLSKSVLRFSLSRFTEPADLEKVLQVLPDHVERIRAAG
jgi:cysteine desulfurase